MLFNSLTFVIFLLLFLVIWNCVARYTRLRLWLLLVASSIFYGWWDWRFLFLIYFTGTVDFFLAIALDRSTAISNEKLQDLCRKLCVAASVFCGIGVLCIFKYSAFFAESISSFLALFGVTVDLRSRIPEFCLILPVGISFYTFQSLSYTIDVYRRRLAPTRNPVQYMAYLMLFPQLVAGPIVRAVDLLPKLLLPPAVSPAVQYNALKLIALGYFKKCVLADNASVVVDMVFGSSRMYTGSVTWLLVMVLFSLQIYCDFSGYSDIARGVIKFMGYRFNLNFNHPYAAKGLQDFWSRWHISLSSWFRDYVYIPLGGNRKGSFRTCFNLFFTFLVSGLWHGAALNFVIWGAYHGVLQIVEKVTGITKWIPQVQSWYARLGIVVLTWIEVLIGWVFFRASSWKEAVFVLERLFSFSAEKNVFKTDVDIAALLAVFVVMELFLIFKADVLLLHKFRWYRRLEPVLVGLLFVCSIVFRGKTNGFIYFQF